MFVQKNFSTLPPFLLGPLLINFSTFLEEIYKKVGGAVKELYIQIYMRQYSKLLLAVIFMEISVMEISVSTVIGAY